MNYFADVFFQAVTNALVNVLTVIFEAFLGGS